MALELIVWSLLAGIGGLAFILGITYKIQFVFLLACILLAVSGMSLFVYDGLIVEKQIVPTDTGWEYENVVVSSSDLSIMSLALILIIIPLLSFMVFEFSPRTARSPSVFHY